jgi:hypothetical protein
MRIKKADEAIVLRVKLNLYSARPISTRDNIKTARTTDEVMPVRYAYPHIMTIMMRLILHRPRRFSCIGLTLPPRVRIKSNRAYIIPVWSPLTASTCAAPEA